MRLQLQGFSATIPIARVYDHKNLFYEVFFMTYSNDGTRTFRFKKGINSEKSQSKRKTAAEETASVLKEALLLGWDPRKDKYPRFDLLQEDKKKILSFKEVLHLSLIEKKKILSKYSMYDYSGAVRFFEKASKETGHIKADADKISKRDIRVILDAAVEQNKWTANSRNKYLTILKALLTVASKRLDLIPFNPAHEIEDVPVLPTEGYKRLTDKERDEVSGFLFANHLAFYEFVIFIYQVGIRRTELLQVRVGDIDMSNRSITIRPDVAKTNSFRHVPLTDELLEICMRRQILTHPSDFFLFSLNFETGPRQIHPNTPSNWWKKIVIDGMGIDCKMYSLKHKGADDKILAGIPIETLKTVYGHKSVLMTEVYAKAVKKKYAEEMIEKAPAFGKVVQMKKAK